MVILTLVSTFYDKGPQKIKGKNHRDVELPIAGTVDEK